MKTQVLKETGPSGPSLKFILILALLLVVLFQGSRGLYETTEGRYSESAREMVASGNYLEPTLDGHPHWTKPPLTYWGIAAGIHLFGTNAWGARAFLIPAFLLTVLAMYWMGKAMWGEDGGRWTALVYTTSLMTGASANVVSTDTLLTMWIALSTAFFWTGMMRKDQRGYLLFWACAGAAFLTKGPPGILFLLGILPVYFLALKQDPRSPRLFTIPGISLFLLLGLGWYLYEAWKHPGLAGYWLGYETIGRLAGMEGEFHNPEWYAAFTVYGPILLLGPLPWIGPWVFRLRKLQKERCSSLSFRQIFLSPQKLYLVLAFFIPLVIFSVSRSKLPLYMLPLFIPFSLFLGRSIHLMASKGLIQGRYLILLAMLSVIFLISLKGIGGFDIGQSSDMKWFHRAILEKTEVSLDRQDLYLMHYKPLYGLEFYREKLLIRINYDDVSWKGGIDPEGLSAQVEGSFQEGRVPLILVRDFNKGKLLPMLPEGIYPEISRVNEDWLLIRLKKEI
ncbi:MAG: glycosyltransferase family 39 protein [Synergistales bacterium]|nr:glycosyltransferase family 39 protein [Synergistales bacterium]